MLKLFNFCCRKINLTYIYVYLYVFTMLQLRPLATGNYYSPGPSGGSCCGCRCCMQFDQWATAATTNRTMPAASCCCPAPWQSCAQSRTPVSVRSSGHSNELLLTSRNANSSNSSNSSNNLVIVTQRGFVMLHSTQICFTRTHTYTRT